MSIRESQVTDYGAIDAVLRAAFKGEEEVMLVHGLRDDDDIELELVSESEGVIDGHIVLSPMQASVRALAFAPLSVLPEKQGKGIGTRLSQAAIKQAAIEKWDAIFVFGNPDYYQRLGFSLSQAKPFSSPYAGPHFMVLELTKDCLNGLQGNVVHASTFIRLEG